MSLNSIGSRTLGGLSKIIKSWSRTDKNYLALLKPKSLFLVFQWCSIQMANTVAAFLVFLRRNFLALWTTLFHIFHTGFGIFHAPSMWQWATHIKTKTGCEKMKMWPKRCRILSLQEELNIKTILNVFK